jgi:SPP1 family predicted phage head-tail adaptor
MTAIGQLDREVIIQELRGVRDDDTGQVVEQWVDAHNVFASIYQRQGRESYEARQNVAFRDDRFVIRFITGLQAKNTRVIYSGNIYEIESVAERGHREFQELVCRYKDSLS